MMVIEAYKEQPVPHPIRRTLVESLRTAPQIGICISYPAPGIIERIGSDWDWLWIDGQHGELDYTDMLNAVRVAELVGRPAVVRVPGHDPGAIGLALDMSPDGIMVPLVDAEDQARAIVRAAKFSPLGSRSYGGRRPIDLHGRGYSHADQPQPLLVCQIESPEGLEHVEAIAAVPGVDVLFLGPDDLALRAGLAMDQPRPPGCFDEAFRKVAQAAISHGKLAGSVFATPEALTYGLSLGYRMIVVGGDMTFLTAGSEDKAQAIRKAMPKSA